MRGFYKLYPAAHDTLFRVTDDMQKLRDPLGPPLACSLLSRGQWLWRRGPTLPLTSSPEQSLPRDLPKMNQQLYNKAHITTKRITAEVERNQRWTPDDRSSEAIRIRSPSCIA